MNLRHYFEREIDQHLAVVEQARGSLAAPFARLTEACVASLKGGGKILFFGNGGSAADAQHLATELTVRYVGDRPAIAALALTTDTSAITATGNDMGFERIFSRQIEALGQPGDVAIALSTSGRSPNVLRGLEQARAQGLVAAALGGGDGGDLPHLADPLLLVPGTITARIQEVHIMLGQMLCGAIEIELGHAREPSP
ncbi:MAG: SIS domain-containing protein [bacterium]|nr:SIS domain-containing protein [bacterium]MDE0416248.1 SIS domain-containing protein [bacterium]